MPPETKAETCRYCGLTRKQHGDQPFCPLPDATYEPGPTRDALAARVAELTEALRSAQATIGFDRGEGSPQWIVIDGILRAALAGKP
jgi:hypothetical protein